MSGPGHNHIRSIFDRWQNLEEEKKRVSDDLKDLFAEAKGNGFDTKALRLAFRMRVKADTETDKDRELQAIVDTYLGALSGPSQARDAHTRTREAQPKAKQDRSASPEARPSASGEHAADESSPPIQVSQAKADDEAEAGPGQAITADVESVSRPAGGRTPAATSENGRDSRERPALNPHTGAPIMPDLPPELPPRTA